MVGGTVLETGRVEKVEMMGLEKGETAARNLWLLTYTTIEDGQIMLPF